MKNLKYILSARWIALLGEYLQSIILPILIFNMNNSSILLSATYIAETLPWIIISPILIPRVNKFINDRVLICLNPLFKSILVFILSIYISNYFIVIIIFIGLGILNSINASYNMKITKSSIPQSKVDKFIGIILGIDDIISVVAPVIVTVMITKQVNSVIILRLHSFLLIISSLLLTRVKFKLKDEEITEIKGESVKSYLSKDNRLKFLMKIEFLRSVAEGIYIPLLIVYFKEIIIAADEIFSLSQTMMCLFQIIFSFAYIRLNKHLSKKNIILIATLNICIALILIINTNTIISYFMACCLLGIGMSLSQLVAENLLITICTEENITTITTKYNSIIALGYLIGYFISLLQVNRYILMYFMVSLCLLIISLFITLHFKENINGAIIRN